MSGNSKESPRGHILVVEDSSVFREMQGLLLGQAGFAVSAHEHPKTAIEAAARQRFDLVVIDYELPSMNGQQCMHALRAIQPDIAVIFVSGSLTLDLAIQLSSQGVAGIFNKPANPKNLLEKINETLFRQARDAAGKGSLSPLPIALAGNSATVGYTPPEPSAGQLAFKPRYVLGESDTFREFTHRLWKVRDFRSVLFLQGEAGSPFELFARDLAEVSAFRDGPVMVCDAAEFEPRRLIEVLAPSLLSGDAGTLIVSGVETFTAEQQATLTNLLTGRDVFLPFARRFRLVVSATQALADRVDAGTFDDTLFYKITAVSLTVPTLRALRGDIAVNARQILTSGGEAEGDAKPVVFSADAMAWLEIQTWPGNYDQLAQTVILARQRAGDGEIGVPALEAAFRQASNGNARVVQVPAKPIAAPAPVAPAAAPVSAPAAVARPQSAPPLAAKSLFRPASTAYNFNQRLTDLLTNPEAMPAR